MKTVSAHRREQIPIGHLIAKWNEKAAGDIPPFVANPLDPAERIPLSPAEEARAGAAIDRFRERTGR